MFYLAGIVITIFLAVLLMGKKQKSTADKILILWFLIIGFHLFLFFLFITGKIYQYPVIMGSHLPYPLLHGPFLYLYTAALTRQQPKNKIAWMLHFLPIIILYLFLIPFFRLSTDEKIMVYQNKGAGFEGLMRICSFAIIVSGVAYVTASLFLLRRYKKSIEEEFSNIEKINLNWLRYMIYGIAVIWIAVITGGDTLVFGASVLFVFFLGYFGIRQTNIFTLSYLQTAKLPTLPAEGNPNESGISVYREQSSGNEINQAEMSTAPLKVKYEKSGLGEQQAEKIYQQLTGSMTNQKLFSDSELTLSSLAKTLDVHPNHLSQVINSYEGKNFYDYINYYRVEEFKKLAPRPDNKNYTLLSMAYECGFNSKTSFNRNFKKVTGISPSEYLLQHHIPLN
jgi:AraC-like DNA-binding protein